MSMATIPQVRHEMAAYLARPEVDGPWPGVVVTRMPDTASSAQTHDRIAVFTRRRNP
jgi:dienelactone hydrolase